MIIHTHKPSHGQSIWKYEIREEILIIRFFDTSSNVNTMMISVLNIILTMFTKLNVWLLILFGLWLIFSFVFYIGCIIGLSLSNIFMGLIGIIEGWQCSKIDKIKD